MPEDVTEPAVWYPSSLIQRSKQRFLQNKKECLIGLLKLREVLRGQLNIPFYFGGTSVLIVVSVTMDTIQQVQSHLLAHQYESLIQKSQLRGKGKGRRKKGTARK